MASQAGKRKIKLTERGAQLAELEKHRLAYNRSSSTANSVESSTPDGGDSNTPAAIEATNAEDQPIQSGMSNIIVIEFSDESDDSPPVTTEELLISWVINVPKRTAEKAFGRDELRTLLNRPPGRRRIHRVAVSEDIDSSIIDPTQDVDSGITDPLQNIHSGIIDLSQDIYSDTIVPSQSVGQKLTCVALGGIGVVLIEIGLYIYAHLD